MVSKRRIFLSVIGLSVFLSGCASQPTSVEADIPLVHANLTQAAVFDDAIFIPAGIYPTDQLIEVDNHSYQVGKKYWSARGQECRKLLLVDSSASVANVKRSMCKMDGRWLLLSPLVQSAKILTEAG
ncbi:hypothetical protein CA267_013770 [Alteromonas pelagimontana]|uniref:Uncharacterized protein n=1 Tax=Alteromonas pelagimontana TaxID=1858656 RepID=A0A6M4MGJ4_9ALTE|nr:hypothetical protein [Alteromonas pelagimontana]QJR81750.1 hypothetical protein CA267_013770 [Alteromonas pelagimontana]